MSAKTENDEIGSVSGKDVVAANAALEKNSKDKNPLIESKRQPLWHVAVLNIFTINGYFLIWFYKNWSDLKKFFQKADDQLKAQIEDSEGSRQSVRYLTKMNVLVHTCGLLLPYLNLFFAGLQFKQIADLYPKRTTVFAKYSLVYALICVCVMAWTLKNFDPQKSTFFYLFLGTIPLVVSQALLNSFWQSVESDKALVRQAFTIGELFLIIMGAGLLGLNLAGLMTGQVPQIKF